MRDNNLYFFSTKIFGVVSNLKQNNKMTGYKLNLRIPFFYIDYSLLSTVIVPFIEFTTVVYFILVNVYYILDFIYIPLSSLATYHKLHKIFNIKREDVVWLPTRKLITTEHLTHPQNNNC